MILYKLILFCDKRVPGKENDFLPHCGCCCCCYLETQGSRTFHREFHFLKHSHQKYLEVM